MGGCLWYPKRRNKTEAPSMEWSSTKGTVRHTIKIKSSPNEVVGCGMPHPNAVMNYEDSKDEVWFDSRLVFDSDSDDDFKSVSGDSLPASFGYAQSSPQPSFIAQKERMNNLVPQDGSLYGTLLLTTAQEPPAKKTLGELFKHKQEEVAKPVENGSKQFVENGSKQFVPIPRQGSKKGDIQDKKRHKSCLPLQPRLPFLRSRML